MKLIQRIQAKFLHAALGCMAMSSPLYAATSAYTATNSGSSYSGQFGAIGYYFTTATPISVTHLGVHDWEGNGLVAATPVAIYSTVNNVLATVTVPIGSGADIIDTVTAGKEYFQALASPVILPAGTYVIANRMDGGGGETLKWSVALTPASGITFGGGLGIANDGVFTDPRSAGGFTNPTPYIGATFKFDVVPLSVARTWDGNGATNPNPNGGSGTWDANNNLNWWNGTTNVTWPAPGGLDDAVFANTAGTVTLATGGVTANNLTFKTTGYSITGQTLTLNGTTPTTTPTITTDPAVSATIGSVIAGTAGLTKAGVGTLILTAENTYTGNTAVNAGTLTLAAGAQLKFVLGATSGVANSITGAGTAIINGNFSIDTSAADTLSNGTWALESVASLTGAYGANFSVVGFTDVGSNKWTKPIGPNLYTFDETTGTLTLGPPTTIDTEAVSSETDNAYAADVSASDLVNNGQTSLASFVSSTIPTFGAGGQNDGAYGLASVPSAAWYGSSNLPATLTFELNVAAHPAGYEISAIRSFAGWKNADTQTYANQKYTIEYRPVGSVVWVFLKSVDYSPFTSLVDTPANTRISLTGRSGVLATGVAALRFNLALPTQSGGTNNGTVLQEIDVVGNPVGNPPEAFVSVTSPTQRHIVQRSSANLASIPITGTYTGTPDRIEARAVVMAGAANSGTTTDWQTIAVTPSGGAFFGTLANVAAGGWYQVEVRGMTGETPGTTAVRDKVGVGDIYITAGQSNSANYGGSAFTPADDRVSTRTSVSAASWRQGYDPQPLAEASGGSVWSRLGDQLAAADNIPIGFICVGVGATQVSQWGPGTANYNSLLKPALQSLGASGCRAVLWHQGESDSLASVTAITHAARLNSMITQSRTDAGWTVPWYLAEASFHPSSNLTQEEPVCAGQRLAAHGDAKVFIGPTTDAFHLEDAAGGKLSDSVHFNAAGLLDFATQWRDILRGTTTATPRNGDFEDNRNPAITGLIALADGASHVVDLSNFDSPSVLGWRVLSANGQTAADGSNGFHNPTTGTYAAAIDTINAGVLPHMDGRHVAVLDGGTANNCFLHTTRATLAPNTRYTLTVALGVRNIASTFGNSRLDILADGVVVATATYDKTALDALHGGDASGSFNDATLSYVTGASVTPNQSLALRIAKVGGVSTVLDFDNVRFTAHTGYEAHQMRYWGSTTHPDSSRSLDPDNDGLTNQQEFAFGTQPTVSTGEIAYSGASLTTPGAPKVVAASGNYSMVFGRRADNVAAGLTYTVQFSTALEAWVDNNDGTNPPVQVATDNTINVMSVPYPNIIDTPSGPRKPTFSRVKVVLAP